MSSWIVKGFFEDILWDIEWAAYVDGRSRFQAWRKVILPIVKPGMAAIAIFPFLAGRSEFFCLLHFHLPEELHPLVVRQASHKGFQAQGLWASDRILR